MYVQADPVTVDPRYASGSPGMLEGRSHSKNLVGGYLPAAGLTHPSRELGAAPKTPSEGSYQGDVRLQGRATIRSNSSLRYPESEVPCPASIRVVPTPGDVRVSRQEWSQTEIAAADARRPL